MPGGPTRLESLAAMISREPEPRIPELIISAGALGRTGGEVDQVRRQLGLQKALGGSEALRK
jgi:hypothetical protein